MTDFDLRSTGQHILCCSACGEPVMGEAPGARLDLHCGYCGKDDVRELTPAQQVSVERVYRGKTPSQRRKAIALDMIVPPEGLERFARLRMGDRDALTQAWRASLEMPRADDDGDVDRRVAFLGLSLAVLLERLHHDALRARATLETTLLHVQLPAFRGLVATRLAMLAVRCGGLELAEKWLEQVPGDLHVAELTSARKVARALVCQAKNDYDGVLDAIGQRDTADEFVPPYRWTAAALRVDAHERRGENKMAYDLWNELSRRGGTRALYATSRLNALAPRTRKRAQAMGFLALGVIALFVVAAGSIFVSVVRDKPVVGWPLWASFAGLALFPVIRWAVVRRR